MKKINKKKFYLRLFSLVFSLFIWLYVVSSAQVEVEKNIPIILELPETYALKEKIKEEVSFTIRGPRIFVRSLLERKDEIRIKADDFFQKGVSNYNIRLQKYQPNFSLGLKLVSFSPKRLSIKIEKAIEKKVPIKVNLDNLGKQDFAFQISNLEPKEVTLYGAKSLVRKITHVMTTPFQRKNNDEPAQELTLGLIAPHSEIKLSLEQVSLNYILASKLSEFTFTKIPIIFQTTQIMKAAFPKQVKVIVKGNADLIKKMELKEIEIYAKVPQDNNGKVTVPLEVKLPAGIELVRTEPSAVSVILEKK